MSHQHLADEIPLPYVATCRTGWRAALLVMWAVVIYGVFFTRAKEGGFAMVQVWVQGNWLTRLGVILSIVCIPALPLEVFRARTVFSETGIEHIPALGGPRTYSYDDITDLDVYPNEFARISFRTGKQLKIWAMRADLGIVERIIRARAQLAVEPSEAEGSS